MFEIGWTEMLVIAIVMIVVVGPKDLPKMLRAFGRTTAKVRSMAGDFQRQFNEALKEAELDDVKKSVDSLKGLNPAAEIRKQLNPFEKAAADVKAGLDAAARPKPVEPAAASVAEAAAPAENEPEEAPAVVRPDPMPSTHAFPVMPNPAPPAAAADPVPAKVAQPAAPAAKAPAKKAKPAAKPAPARTVKAPARRKPAEPAA